MLYCRCYFKDVKEVTAADFAKYSIVLFGDPGSNRWIARLRGKLPVRWTHDAVTLGAKSFPSREYFPALVYPNPLNPRHYVVLNSGLTIDEREYRADYSLPRWATLPFREFRWVQMSRYSRLLACSIKPGNCQTNLFLE